MRINRSRELITIIANIISSSGGTCKSNTILYAVYKKSMVHCDVRVTD